MKAERKITQTMVRSLTGNGTDRVVILWDAETRGFGVKYNPATGHKGFIVKRGNVVRAVGSADTMTVEKARDEARDILNELRKGIDRKAVAAAEKKAAEERRRADVTFGEVLEKYCGLGRIKASTAAFYRTSAARWLADWKDEPLRTITEEMVLEKYEEIIKAVTAGGRGTGIGMANMIGRIASKTWNHGVKLKVRGLGANPVKAALEGDPRRKMEPRADHVPLDRLKDFHDALAQLPVWQDPAAPMKDYPAADVLRLILYTGLRRGNARALRWSQVDFERKMVRIDASEMKGKRRLDLPMNQLVEDLLKRRMRLFAPGPQQTYEPDCPWVFPGLTGGHVTSLRQPLLDAVKLARLPHCSVHGLRRTFASACYESGLSIEQTGMLLSHAKPGGVTAGYIQNLESRMPAFVATVGDYIAQAIGMGTAGGNVRPLVRKTKTKVPAPVPAGEIALPA